MSRFPAFLSGVMLLCVCAGCVQETRRVEKHLPGSRKHQSVQETAKGKLRFYGGGAEPDVVSRGKGVYLSMEYRITGLQPNEKMRVHETRHLYYGDAPVVKPMLDAKFLGNGHYRSRKFLPIPENAKPGQYKVVSMVSMAAYREKSVFSFSVQE